jgi:hypothetical protein
MKPQTTKNAGPGAPRILAAFQDAENAKVLFVHKAVICGQMLREQRQDLMTCHDGKSWNDRTKEDEACFHVWLLGYCPSIPERTAYRWMESANRVVGHLLEIHHSNTPVWIELDGERYFISTVLTMPEADCTEAMRTFRETFNTFLADKTLAEATQCALNGCDESHRITRAANGKEKGGTRGENRRAYARFLAIHFKEMTQCIERWDKFISENPSEHAKMTEAVRAVVLGGKFKIEEKGRPTDFKGWPKSFSDLMLGVLKERVRTVSQNEN